MWNTVNTQPSHFDRGFWSIGSGPIKVLFHGSCRVVPYVNYFHYLNADNRFTINLVNVVNFYYDRAGGQADAEKEAAKFEGNPETLKMLKECKWFIHEFSQKFGMFNSDKAQPKHIYQYGLNPEFDIQLPNLHCIHVMAAEYMKYDPGLHAQAVEDVKRTGKLSPELLAEIKKRGLGRIEHFIELAKLSGIPDFASLFAETWRNRRYFWTGTHISNQFSIEVMRLMNEKYFKLTIPNAVWQRAQAEDLYATPREPITQYDVENYNLTWPQPIEELKL